MDSLERQMLLKLYRRNCWGGKMINYSDLIRLVPSHLRGDAKKAVRNLHMQGFLNSKPGIQTEFRYSLRIDKKSEIEKELY
jgi:hypothetical protein